jgi:hypothetical protein
VLHNIATAAKQLRHAGQNIGNLDRETATQKALRHLCYSSANFLEYGETYRPQLLALLNEAARELESEVSHA